MLTQITISSIRRLKSCSLPNFSEMEKEEERKREKEREVGEGEVKKQNQRTLLISFSLSKVQLEDWRDGL